MCHRVERPQDVVPLATRGRPHEQPRRARQATQERRQDEVSGVHEEHLPPASAGLLQSRPQLLLHEGGLFPGVLLDRLLGRHGDGAGLAPAQSQSALEEVADLAEAPADAGLLLDEGLRLLGRADRVLQEVLLQRVLVLGQGAVGVMPPAAAQVRQAALIILVEVALDGAPGDVGVGGDLVVSQAVALQPEDLHLAPDAGVGVVVTVVGQGVPIVRREGDDPHDGSTLMLSPGCSPSAVYTHTLPPTICARPGRAEYNLSCISSKFRTF